MFIERLRFFFVYDTDNAAVIRDAISRISESGNPTIASVSLADSTIHEIHLYSCNTHTLSGDKQCLPI